MASSHKDMKDQKKDDTSMIHISMRPVDGFARLEHDHKVWLLRESRQAGMLTIDFKAHISDELKEEFKTKMERILVKKKEIMDIPAAKRTAEQKENLRLCNERIEEYPYICKGFKSKRYALVNNKWDNITGDKIEATKLHMKAYDSLTHAEQKEYIESLFNLLLKDHFSPELMRQPPPAEASNKSAYEGLLGHNYHSYIGTVGSKGDASLAKAHSVFGAAAAASAPKRNALRPEETLSDDTPDAPGGPGQSKKHT